MGCDIHFYVERRAGEGLPWEPCDTWSPARDADEPGETEVLPEHRFYDDRNYDLFAILADVRNGRGFAGIKTGEGFNPICQPRGLPDDVTARVRAESDRWGEDGHSHSSHTLEDLLRCDWTQQAQHRGCVEWPEYVRLKDTEGGYGHSYGMPRSWCASVSGGTTAIIAVAEAEQKFTALGREEINALRRRAVKGETFERLFVDYHWAAPYFASCKSFLGETVPKLLKLAEGRSFRDVRIVFWFDN